MNASDNPLTPANSHPPVRPWGLGLAALVFLILVITGIYQRAESSLPKVLQEYSQLMRELRDAESAINAEVLAISLEFTKNYDAVSLHVLEARRAIGKISGLPIADLGGQSAAVSAAFNSLNEGMSAKSEFVEDFKSNHAVLRTVLVEFPNSTDQFVELLGKSGVSRQIQESVETYEHRVLAYALARDSLGRTKVHESAKRLADLSESLAGVFRADLAELQRRGEEILMLVTEADQLTQNILTRQVAQEFDEKFQYLLKVQGEAERFAAYYRALLFGLSLVLAGYLVFAFFKLEGARRSLLKANRELAERNASQQRAESLLRLHAKAFNNSHEGTMLTDAQGTILDVNPAFSRITGYDRSEVIGRNPRILSSGRHDPDFYAAMWRSLRDTGVWRGEIWNRSKYGDVHAELLSISAVHDVDGKLANFVAVFADISGLKEQEKQLTQMAYYDALTGLPNRTLLADRMRQASSQVRRSDSLMAVCYLDLDGFKPVNDTWGHGVGDQLLVEMANRFKTYLRGADTVARLGGDEFVFLMPGMTTKDECEQAVQRLLRVVGQPVCVTPQPVTLSASIGITIFPLDNSDPEALLRHADQAMYQAKLDGKNRYQLFDPVVDSVTHGENSRVTRIREALERTEFVLHYLPKANMRTGVIVGAEALIRWQVSEQSLIGPGEFLPAIETSDLMVQLGDWVIESALSQMEVWRQQGLELPISVNVAGKQLQAPTFVKNLNEALRRHPTVAHLLQMEVSEATALEDMLKISQVIEACSELGVTFSLDDFGGGYSSLAYLKRFDKVSLKIDQRYVCELLHDPGNLVIIQGVLGLARAFRRQVVAEGVESAAHGRMLLQLDCDLAQGYAISPPIPGDRIPAWVNAWQPDTSWMAIADLVWDDSDYPALIAEVEHRHWIGQFVAAVRDHKPIQLTRVDDPRSGRFGEWYHGADAHRYRMSPAFLQMEEPHRRIHELAGKLDTCVHDGDFVRAQELLEEMLVQRDKLMATMWELQIQVARVR